MKLAYKYFLVLGVSAALVGCNLAEERENAKIKEFVSINHCGKHFANLTFVSASDKINVLPVKNNSTVKDSLGNEIKVPALSSSFNSEDCTISKLTIPSAEKVKSEISSLREKFSDNKNINENKPKI